ncbi:MAG TPA: hypothetical protein VFQ54_07830, partial [Thermomicrobiales bacterium]|nr:hypothetical protein [Thermomicrobiales bacterium]
MSYDVSAVTTYLTDHYPELIAEASITDLDPVVSDVTAIYIAYPTLDTGWANPLADYYFLKRVAAAFAPNFDLSDQTGALSL